MPLPIPSAWLALGAVLAVVFSYLAGNWHGHGAEKVVWEKAIAEQKAEASKMLADATAEAAVRQKELSDLNVEVESQHAKHQQQLAASNADLQRVAAELDRVRGEQGRGDGSSCPVPTGPGATPVAKAAPAGHGGGASGSFSELAAIAEDCKAVAKYAAELKVWVDGIQPKEK